MYFNDNGHYETLTMLYRAQENKYTQVTDFSLFLCFSNEMYKSQNEYFAV